MTLQNSIDLHNEKFDAEARVRIHFLSCITPQQLDFLTLYICGEDHEVTDRELEVAIDIYTRGYNQAVRDIRGMCCSLPNV